MAKIREYVKKGYGKTSSIGSDNKGYSYSNYYGVKSFKRSKEVAIENRYAYFGDYLNEYQPIDTTKLLMKKSKEKHVYLSWMRIMENALTLLEKREKKLNTALKELKTKMLQDKTSNILKLSGKNDAVSQAEDYIKLINYVYIDNEVSTILNEQLPSILSDGINIAIEKYTNNFNINEMNSNKINSIFWNDVYSYIKETFKSYSSTLGSKISGIEGQIDSEAIKMLTAYGKIEFNNSKAANQLSERLIDNLSFKPVSPDESRIKGVSGELTGLISSAVRSNINGSNSKFKSTGLNTHAEGIRKGLQIKTDMEATYEPITINNVKIPKIKFLFNIKRAGMKLEKSGDPENLQFIHSPPKIEGFSKIQDALAWMKVSNPDFSMTKHDFNLFMYHFNNEIIRNKGKRLNSANAVVQMLSYSILSFMFDEKDIQEVKDIGKTGNDTTLLFIINGKIIPVSLIFKMMLNKVEGMLVKNYKIINVQVLGPQKSNVLAAYQDQKEEEMKDGIPWKRDSRWNFARDWIEERSTVSFQFYIEEIKNQLKLNI